MAIFTEQTQFVEKYFEEYMKAIKAIPEDQAEEQFKKIYGFYANYSELKYEEKCHMAKLDFQKFIEVILERHQDYKTCELTSSEEVIEKDLQVILRPLREKNVFFYPEQCYSKLPRDIVKKLELEAVIVGKTMSNMNYEQALQEVRSDMKAENKKWGAIEGYGILKQLLDVLPDQESMDKLYVENDVLYFDYNRIGKISNIERVYEDRPIDLTFNRTIVIERTRGEHISIEFIHGKNPETGKWEYVRCEFHVGD